MSNIQKLADENLQQALLGALQWNRFLEEEKPTNSDCVLFFPEIDDEINMKALQHLHEYTLSAKVNKLYVFYCDSLISVEFPRFYTGDYKIVHLPPSDMDAFMKLFCLENTSNRVIIISLCQPQGRYGKYAIERNGVNLEEAVKYGIYKMEYKNEY